MNYFEQTYYQFRIKIGIGNWHWIKLKSNQNWIAIRNITESHFNISMSACACMCVSVCMCICNSNLMSMHRVLQITSENWQLWIVTILLNLQRTDTLRFDAHLDHLMAFSLVYRGTRSWSWWHHQGLWHHYCDVRAHDPQDNPFSHQNLWTHTHTLHTNLVT